MAEEIGQSRARVTAGGLVGSDWRWAVVHDEWEGWSFALTMGGAGELLGFEVYGGGAALTARRIRDVPFRELESAVRRRVAGTDGVRRSLWLASQLKPLDLAPQKRQRAKWTEAELARLCADYVALVDAADPAPLATLATQRALSPKYMRNLIAGVRGDLITHSRAGLAGGQLTDKAKEILSGQH